MKTKSPNQFTGRFSPGFRFCFHVRAIAHRSIFLPIAMRGLPQIQRLIKGESPLNVFDCNSFPEARRRFDDLRKKYDFPFWAITEYYIHDVNDADNIIPLRLNRQQRYVIDIMLRRYDYQLKGRYAISKSSPKCGLTTCVQAYIHWMQQYRCANNSYTCSSADINIHPLKSDLCRLLHRDIVPSDKWLYIPKADRNAYFNTYRSPDFIRGINLGYVHLADMSKWKDPKGTLSSRTFAASSSAVLLEYFTLVVLEGNIPNEDRFQYSKFNNFHLPFDFRMWKLEPLSKNPYFLDHVALIDSLKGKYGYTFINIEHIDDSNRRINYHLFPSRLPQHLKEFPLPDTYSQILPL